MCFLSKYRTKINHLVPAFKQDYCPKPLLHAKSVVEPGCGRGTELNASDTLSQTEVLKEKAWEVVPDQGKVTVPGNDGDRQRAAAMYT